MFNAYSRAMDWLHRLCLGLCGLSLLVISLIIPWGVYSRYVMGKGSHWPEPLAILLMIVLSFLSAALCYRDNLHIGVMVLPNRLQGAARLALGWLVELCMLATNLFMLVYGLALVQTTWNQTISEFPIISVGLSYMPIPVGGTITLLFLVERLWAGRFFEKANDEIITASPVE
ncbi:MAG: TRAP transporter small permease [Reyranella sp.]|nr:MAG: TRAP transporter small permease [Reyranella sp.]TBR28196.1 MAG: TRAP transporter small permease [Reyranella sp.]